MLGPALQLLKLLLNHELQLLCIDPATANLTCTFMYMSEHVRRVSVYEYVHVRKESGLVGWWIPASLTHPSYSIESATAEQADIYMHVYGHVRRMSVYEYVHVRKESGLVGWLIPARLIHSTAEQALANSFEDAAAAGFGRCTDRTNLNSETSFRCF